MRKLSMTRLTLMGSAFCAALVLVALAAATAMGAEIEWLDNGEALTSAHSTESSGELEFTDTKAMVGEAAILCSEIYAGNVTGPGTTEAEYTTLLNLAKETIGALGGLGLKCLGVKLCEAEGAEEWVVLLPIAAHLLLDMGGTIELLHYLRPRFEFTCLVLGMTLTDECSAGGTEELLTGRLANVTGGVEVSFSKSISEEEGGELETCSLGGAKTGIITGKLLTTLTEGGTLSVS